VEIKLVVGSDVDISALVLSAVAVPGCREDWKFSERMDLEEGLTYQ